MSEPLVPRDEARAALEARTELGPGYDDELVERFARRIEERLVKHSRVPTKAETNQRTAIVIVSLVAAIPLIAIAGGLTGLAGVIAVCAALALVNYFAWKG